ncbi:hypothetical protein HQ545_03455 [Candidatus Woesearchaeota archaeon]|nr:hypothetical protein [Candidatus Woesearchaeota archaeon]
MDSLSLLATNNSEKRFFELLAGNSQLPVKQFCRKISRKTAYKYIKRLENIQQVTGMKIFERSAIICPITSLPNIIIRQKCQIQLRTSENATIITFSPGNG